MVLNHTEHIESTAYRYGRNCKRCECTRAGSLDYVEYDKLCTALWRELETCGAVDDDGKLRPPYNALYQAGRDSVHAD